MFSCGFLLVLCHCMFNWLKRKKSVLQNLNFEGIADFEMIQNPDSLQYFNKDASKTIYFSVLEFSGQGVFPIDSYINQPIMTENANGWQLKGTKKLKTKYLYVYFQQ